MDRGPSGGRRPCLGGGLPAAVETRRIAIAPGGVRDYDEADWRGALVIVARGEVELECLRGGRQRIGRGDVLWLAGLPLRALHNRGRVTAHLVAIARGEGR